MFFKGDEYPCCANCEYADLYIPYYTYPYHDPYCSKGHGKCEVDKFCEDYRLINSHFCYECSYFEEGFCSEKQKHVDLNKDACVYFKLNCGDL